MLILTNEEVESILTMEDCIEVLEHAFAELGHGRAIATNRYDLSVPAKLPSAAYYRLKTMNGALPSLNTAAVRINSDVATYPVKRGILRQEKVPAAKGKYVGFIILFNSNTGEPLMICPDGVVQRMRVGATSGLGAKYLAREDAKTVGLLGSGWQAGAQLMALKEVRNIKLVKVYSPAPEHRIKFAEEMSKALELEVQPCRSADEAVKDVDILHAATNTRRDPVFDTKWVKEGIHLGFIVPSEMSEKVMRKCDVLAISTNSWERTRTLNYTICDTSSIPEPQFLKGAWWNKRSWTSKMTTLGEIIIGKATGRKRASEKTCFWNFSNSVQFAAVGAKLYELALKEKLGREIPTEWFLQSVHP